MIPKFRVWDKKYKEIMKVNQINFETRTACLEADNGDHEMRHTLTRSLTDIELMQSTGLKDKNDVAIFEGDVVFHEEGECSYTGIVRKDRCYFYIEGVNVNDSFSFDDVSDTYTGEANLEVIGNIYENPELLEAK